MSLVATFAKLVNHPSPEDAEIQILDVGEWDTQGQYKEIVDATREATKGSTGSVERARELSTGSSDSKMESFLEPRLWLSRAR